ncbi:MAG TPA: histidine kinase [Burkholderiaceae bacterium]
MRTHLLLLVLACVLPAAAAAAYALASTYHALYQALAERAQADAGAMAKAVDNVISTAIGRLQALASSQALADGDIAGFDEFARRVQPFLPGTNLVLSDIHGRQLVNTALPRGAPLPMHGNPAFQRSVLLSGRPAVSDLFVGGALKRPLIAIEVPVRENGIVTYTLAMGFLPERFARIIAEHQLEPDWVVSIFDSTGTIVARTHEPERYVGQKGVPAVLGAMAREPRGIVETTTLEGTPVTAVYSRSEVARWTIAVGIPEALLAGRVRHWFALLVASAVGMLLLGAALAQAVSARITTAIRALLEPARALGRGELVQPAALAVREAQVVGDALVRASALLRERTGELARATQDLEESHGALRRLMAALDRAQDDERKRIARELHDDLQQTLAAIGMEAAAAGPVLAEQPAPVRRALERVQVLASTALLSTRRIIADLRPQVLEELGLVAALRNLAEVHATRHGMPCDVEIDDALENLVLSPSVSGCLYRVAQEALNNIAKHARAGSVAIVLHQLPGGDLRLHVLDDGCGLASGADAKPQAFGLLGMSERVHAVGGRLRVYSSAQAGTVVEAILPLDVHPTDSPAPTPI